MDLTTLDIRLGLGTLSMTGSSGLGLIPDRGEAARTIKSAVAHGVQLIDTAWYYGPDCVNRLIADCLHPYPEDLALIVKLGNTRDTRTGEYKPAVAPEELRVALERSLKELRVQAAPVILLRWRDDLDRGDVFLQAWQTVLGLQSEGKAESVGLSNVPIELVRSAQKLGDVSIVSNAFSVLDQSDRHTMQYCGWNNICYLPYYPLQRGAVFQSAGVLTVSEKLGWTPAQVAVAWLLAEAPHIVPIPGTAQTNHLKQLLDPALRILDSDGIQLLKSL